jgi:SH3 domain-containing YSC84-like protein 1
MKRISYVAVAATMIMGSAAFAADEQHGDVTKRLEASRQVVTEMMGADDKGVPQDLLEKARCVIIVPGLKKGGFIVGAQYGKGFAVCRDKARKWGSPAAMRIEGGSVGFQIGATETDLILLVMNDDGMKNLLKSKFQLGGEATAAAGPVGRDVSARTDAMMHAEMLTYSRAHGVFAGISLEGSTLRQDLDDNKDLYGKSMTNTEILNGTVPLPAGAKEFRATLAKYAH